MMVGVRGIIPFNDRILLCQNSGNEPPFWCLPGGRLEEGETLVDGLSRELEEELGMKAQIGKLLVIREFIRDDGHDIEFYFHISNGVDFLQTDVGSASHGYEISTIEFLGISELQEVDIRPRFLRELLPEFSGKNYDVSIRHVGRV